MIGVSETQIADWRARYAGLDGESLLRPFLETELPGRLTLLSSFGADAVVLLHMVSRIDRKTPITMLDTGKLFAETLKYRDAVLDRFGLETIRVFKPDPMLLDLHDPDGGLHARRPETCCAIRKTEPLTRALYGFVGWITGRKRHQAGTRADLETIELSDGKVKLNPLAPWDHALLRGYIEINELPEHPLVAQGYPSIGCAVCTSRVFAGEDLRAGRWRGLSKTECGIHAETVI